MHGSEFRLRTSAGSTQPFGKSSAGGPGPWPALLARGFGGRTSYLRHLLRSALLAAGAVAAVPALDLLSWSMSAQPWAGDLFRVTGLLFVVAVAMSGAAVLVDLAGWDDERPLPRLRLDGRRVAPLASTVLVVVVQLAQRFGPENPAAGPALLALDVLLVGLLAACSVTAPRPTSSERYGRNV